MRIPSFWRRASHSELKHVETVIDASNKYIDNAKEKFITKSGLEDKNKNVSYAENELKKSSEEKQRYIIDYIDGKKIKNRKKRFNLNIDGAPIASRSHTHPSHSQTSRL